MPDSGQAAFGGKPHWAGTLLYVPILYGVGWLLSRPVMWFFPALRPDQLDLIGALLALILLLLTLPWRLRNGLGVQEPWRFLGLVGSSGQILGTWLRGVLKAAALLFVVVFVLLLVGAARWRGFESLNGATILNALALTLGVGFAEELIFRGWLWGELTAVLSRPKALFYQALFFGLVHPWWRLPGFTAIGLLGGLILLGVALGLQRRADSGRLWGAMGLHGGLVGGWFAIQSGPLSLMPSGPEWLMGPGGVGGINPIGGFVGWFALAAMIMIRRSWWS